MASFRAKTGTDESWYVFSEHERLVDDFLQAIVSIQRLTMRSIAMLMTLSYRRNSPTEWEVIKGRCISAAPSRKVVSLQ